MPMCTFKSPTPGPVLVLVLVLVCNASHVTRNCMSMLQSNYNGMQHYQLYLKNVIQNCVIQSNDNAMQHYQLCCKNMIQIECKSANCAQHIAIEIIQEMYAAAPKRF